MRSTTSALSEKQKEVFVALLATVILFSIVKNADGVQLRGGGTSLGKEVSSWASWD
jgi:hypothetical protein